MGVLDIIIIFLGILFKYLLCYGVSQTILYGLLVIICLFTLIDIYKLKLEKNNWNKVILFLVISLFFVITQLDVNFLISTLFACIISKKEEKSFVKVFFISSIILFVLTIFLNTIGVLENQNLIRYKNGEVIIRYSLGFDHPNTVFLFFLPIALGGYYLYSNKVSYYLVLLLSSSILYKLCDSRTGFLCMLSIILLHCTITSNFLNKKTIKLIIKNSILIFTIITIITCKLYGYNLTNPVSKLFSGRPYYLNYYLKNNLAFSLLGANYIKEYYLDNFYMYMLAQLGLVGYSIYYLIYKEGIKKVITNKKYIVILIVFCIYGLLESNVIIGSINFLFPILIKNIIISKKEIRCNL